MKDYSLFRVDSGSGNFPPPPPPPPPSFNAPPPPPPPSNQPQNSGSASSNAIIALVLGILSYIACGIFASIPAWIVGKKELNEINAGRSPEAGRTLANIGMWLGIINVILFILGMIFVVIAIMFGLLNVDDYT
ncbi:MAG TPA: DUF4190 domain-containing protein [Ignavibacteria bacterium]|nr:DUF4190 domain-containing protein [Ignavibacteria bacterium]HMR39235.1 DUF4190 domain-containing protein [Ignavibacteria bacterium]